MQQYFQLDPKEKAQELAMLTFAVLSFLTIAKGIYNQSHNIDQDYFLVPFVMTTFGCYFGVQSVNGLTKGNLIPKWTPFFIFQLVYFFTKFIGVRPKKKARTYATKCIGILSLLVSISLFSTAIFYLITKH